MQAAKNKKIMSDVWRAKGYRQNLTFAYVDPVYKFYTYSKMIYRCLKIISTVFFLFRIIMFAE